MSETGKRGQRKVRIGTVLKRSADKTAVVVIEELMKHPHYKKYVRRVKKLLVHDEQNDCSVGDRVRIVETRPLSKMKHWRVAQILEKAK